MIVEIDGIPAIQYLKDNYFDKINAKSMSVQCNTALQLLFIGKPDSKVKLKVQLPSSSKKIEMILFRNTIKFNAEEDWAYKMEKENKPVDFKLLNPDIAYLRFQSFDMSQTDTINSLVDIHYDKLKASKGIIIDLRGNPGGPDWAWGQIVPLFCEEDSINMGVYRERINFSFYRAKGAYSDSTVTSALGFRSFDIYAEYHPYFTNEAVRDFPMKKFNHYLQEYRLSQPIIVLVNSNTGSAAEGMVVAMKSMKNVTVMGEKTYGALGMPLFFTLPYGGMARICANKTFTASGEDVSDGIEPDIVISPDITDILENKDPVLEKVVEVLLNKGM